MTMRGKDFKYPLTAGPIALSDAAARAGEITFGRPAEVSDRSHRMVTDEELAAFCAGCERIIEAYYVKHGLSDERPKVKFERLKRYARVYADYEIRGQRLAHCFVDLSNGDVLKTQGWKKPAKHARGNLFDASCGLGRMRWSGTEHIGSHSWVNNTD